MGVREGGGIKAGRESGGRDTRRREGCGPGEREGRRKEREGDGWKE